MRGVLEKFTTLTAHAQEGMGWRGLIMANSQDRNPRGPQSPDTAKAQAEFRPQLTADRALGALLPWCLMTEHSTAWHRIRQSLQLHAKS